MQKKRVELYEEDLVLAHDRGCPDVRRVLKQMAPHIFDDEIIYKLGQKFLVNGQTFILAFANEENTGCSRDGLLVNINDGYYFNVKRVPMRGQSHITKQDFDSWIDEKYTIIKKEE